MKKYMIILLIVIIGLSLIGCSDKQSDSDFDMFTLFHDGLVAVSIDDKWGYIDTNGDTAIDFVYDGAGAFYNGYAIVLIDDLYTMIDTAGNTIFEDKYERLFVDFESKLIIYRLNDKTGLMNTEEEVIIDAVYDGISLFSEGLAVAQSNDQFGYINTEGEVIIPIEYDYAESFSNGLAMVKSNDKIGYLDDNGDVVIDFIYDLGNPFYNDFTIVKTEELDYLINIEGDTILSGEDIKGYGGLLYGVKNSDDGLYYLYTSDGDQFDTTGYENVSLYYNSKDSYFAKVTTVDEEVLNIWFNEDGTIFKSAPSNESYIYTQGLGFAFSYSKDLMVVHDEENVDIYTQDNTYRIVADYISGYFSNEYFVVYRNDQYGIVNLDGDIEVEFLYDDIIVMKDGFFLYMNDDLFGFMNDNFDIITNAEYDDLNVLTNPKH
ncbi:WG repeat-containing protein [Mycoplasmatota bacterium]|nr:WG repeat-containing protein [Mycoplasmatota bacterium]